VSSESQDDVVARLLEGPSSPIGHWKIPGDDVFVELIAAEMPPRNADNFMEYFARVPEMSGWKITVWRLR
jgi:hypothetical protein